MVTAMIPTRTRNGGGSGGMPVAMTAPRGRRTWERTSAPVVLSSPSSEALLTGTSHDGLRTRGNEGRYHAVRDLAEYGDHGVRGTRHPRHQDEPSRGSGSRRASGHGPGDGRHAAGGGRTRAG